MKKILFLLGFVFCALPILRAQSDYKVVFDLTGKDTVAQQSVIRWTNGILKESASAKVEIVMYSQGLSLVTKDRSLFPNEVAALLENKNVSFVVCEAAMKNQK